MTRKWLVKHILLSLTIKSKENAIFSKSDESKHRHFYFQINAVKFFLYIWQYAIIKRHYQNEAVQMCCQFMNVFVSVDLFFRWFFYRICFCVAFRAQTEKIKSEKLLDLPVRKFSLWDKIISTWIKYRTQQTSSLYSQNNWFYIKIRNKIKNCTNYKSVYIHTVLNITPDTLS